MALYKELSLLGWWNLLTDSKVGDVPVNAGISHKDCWLLVLSSSYRRCLSRGEGRMQSASNITTCVDGICRLVRAEGMSHRCMAVIVRDEAEEYLLKSEKTQMRG